MQWQLALPYTIPLSIATALALWVVSIAWSYRATPGAPSLAVVAGAAAFWCLTYALELSTVGSTQALFWARVQYLAIMTIPVGWVVFALHYTNRAHWLTWPVWAALLAIPLLTQILVWTNDRHRLIWAAIALDTSGPIPIQVYTHGPAFWLCNGFSHLCLLAGTILLLSSFWRAPRVYTLQIVTVFVGAGAPWLANGLYVLRLTPWPGLDLTPFGFAWAAAAMAVSVVWFRFLNLVPIARAIVLDRMPTGVIVLSADHQVVDLNARALHTLGLSLRATVGRPAAEVFAAWPQIVERYSTTFSARDTLVLSGPDGAPEYVSIEIAPVYDGQQRLRGKLVMWNNVTDLKRTEIELRQRNDELIVLQQQQILAKEAAEAASRAKSNFLANVSHELRTPLTAILGYTQLIRLELQHRGIAELDGDVQAVELAGGQLLEHINALLDLSKAEADRLELYPERFQVADLVADIRRIISPLIGRNENSFTITGEDTAGSMLADRLKLQQILLNLLSNATKFTHRGRIELHVERRSVTDGPDLVLFTVADTGIGIEPADLPYIFDVFTQADHGPGRILGGTGLGLAISRRFARLMGGEITVVSSPGAGTQFTVRLPAESPLPSERSQAGNLLALSAPEDRPRTG